MNIIPQQVILKKMVTKLTKKRDTVKPPPKIALIGGREKKSKCSFPTK